MLCEPRLSCFPGTLERARGRGQRVRPGLGSDGKGTPGSLGTQSASDGHAGARDNRNMEDQAGTALPL